MAEGQNKVMPPASAIANIQQEYMKKKHAFEEAFKEFHKQVFSSKVLDENKSAAVKNTEHFLVDKLINSAVALDNANVGEGLLALTTIAIRELLTMRDRNNEIEYSLYKLIRDFNGVKRELGIKDDEKKK